MHPYTAGSEQLPCPHSYPQQNPCFPCSWEEGTGRDGKGGPTSGQLPDPPQFSVPVFPLTSREVQKKINQNSKGQEFEPFSRQFPLHPRSAEERRSVILRWDGGRERRPACLALAPPPHQALRATLCPWPPHQPLTEGVGCGIGRTPPPLLFPLLAKARGGLSVLE